MDKRECPNYEACFDACDPLASVLESEWCNCGDSRAARVLRRRCRSEGVERSPYEDANRAPHFCNPYLCMHLRTSTKSHFTLNNGSDKLNYPIETNTVDHGDHNMATQRHSFFSERQRLCGSTPPRPVTVSAINTISRHPERLPKVEEFFDKVDNERLELPMTKQPLKSILNNPKSQPQSILKKPKSKYMDPKVSQEGRRRHRAASESDNTNYFHMSLSNPGQDSRLTYLSSSTKRAKDNTGTGYTYGSTNQSYNASCMARMASYKNRCSCKEQISTKSDGCHILRTTAINIHTIKEKPKLEASKPVMSPSLPVSSITGLPVRKTVKKKIQASRGLTKVCERKCELDEEDVKLSRTCSSDVEIWEMDTDPPSELEKREVNLEQSTLCNLSTKLTNGAVVTPRNCLREGSPLRIPESFLNCLRPSLFPRVPPYIKFISHDEQSTYKIPMGLQKHMKWKLTTITPIVVKKTLINSGFKLVKSECDTAECPQEETVEWIGIWGKHMKSLMFRAIKDGQKMNHYPGTFQVGRKDRLWRNLQKLVAKHGLNEFGIMPKTYVLPHDLKLLKNDWEKHAANNEKWIIKPPASARGTGIKVVSRWAQIPKKRPVVVQRYVSKPYLINGSKFDMRLYVLVTSVHPLRIYLYKDGLARFASVKYNDELCSLNDRYMHLTNYSINRLSKNYTPNEDFAACEGHKWTLQSLFQYLKTEKKVNIEALWDSMKDLVIKTILSGEASISSLTKANVTSRYNCYELFGIDVLLDEDLKPWLLEVNISPSLHSASPLDIHVKGPLVTTVLNIAQFQVPAKTNLESLTKDKPHKLGGLVYDSRLYTVYLSKEERDKHIIYTNMDDRELYLRDILSTLTSDDVRHLIQSEDELTQVNAGMERIFPTRETYKYLNFLSGPRYYNRLFDAWETRYGVNRESGLLLLRNLCDIGYHLEVPPVPLKPAATLLSAVHPCRMISTRTRRLRVNGPSSRLKCSRALIRVRTRSRPFRPRPSNKPPSEQNGELNNAQS